MTKHAHLLLALLAGCKPCEDNPLTEDIACDGEVCPAVGTETGGAVCTPHIEPEFDHQFMICGTNYSTGEHCTQDAANSYEITDYAFETSAFTFAVKFDFQGIPAVWDPSEPEADWWTWSGNWLTALPGVLTHTDDADRVWAAYASRGCCAQWVVDGSLEHPTPNPTCGSGYTLNDTPDAYCLAMLDGSGAGLCVYPCADAYDCPNPAGEFCDLTHPDPGGLGPGVCRYKSMPAIPTPFAEVGN